jgi:hypothetical protein
MPFLKWCEPSTSDIPCDFSGEKAGRLYADLVRKSENPEKVQKVVFNVVTYAMVIFWELSQRGARLFLVIVRLSEKSTDERWF